MQKRVTLFTLILMVLTLGLAYGQTYNEDFEDGDVNEWQQYRLDEEMIQAVDMTSAPAVLVGGGDKVGYIQDADYSYSGAAILLTGDPIDMNYTVEADVYVYENAAVSAYTGIVAYADSSHQGPHSYGYYVKLAADFDGDNRFRLYNNQLNFSTFQYSFHESISAENVDKTQGWHHMKVVVTTNADNSVSYQCFYDEIDLGTYVDNSDLHTTSGQPGLYAFQQNGVDGLAGYFDNYVVTPNGSTSIDETTEVLPTSMVMHQNFPNPFNPSTTISFDIQQAGEARLTIVNVRGEVVATLAQGHIQPGSYQVTWDGKNSQGQTMAAGNYIAILTKGNEQVSRNMLMLK